jgi:AAA domain
MSACTIHATTANLPPRILVYGPEGVGKTTLAARFPAPVFLQTEDGCPGKLSIDTFGMLDGYKPVRDALSFLAGEQHEHHTVVIDSLDALEPLIWRDACASQGWASVEAVPYGKAYTIIDAWWHDILAGLDFLRRERGMTVVLLAHSAIERIDDPRAASYTSYQLRLHKRARALVQDWTDAILFLAPDLNLTSEDAGFGKKRTRADGGSTRWLHCEGRPSFVAKNRFSLPIKIVIPLNFDYDAVLAPYFPSAVAE